MLVVSIIVFVGLLLALVLVHEWGHFMAARMAGCKVEEFAFGFPPRLFSFKQGETRYAFNLLPLGGYVKIEGEDMEDPNPGPTSFAGKSGSWRIFILSAGVIMNVILAAVFLTIQAGVGVPTLVDDNNAGHLKDLQTFIVGVDPASPAAVAGIQPLDRIVKVEDIERPTIDQVQALVSEKQGELLALEIERQGRRESITLTPRTDPPPGEGSMGIALRATGLEKTAWWKAPVAGVTRTWELLKAIIVEFGKLIGKLFKSEGVGESLTGPVGIAIYANEVTKLGPSYILEFGALISLNLAIINILPFPALDGGRIVFVLFEMIFRRRMPVKVEQYTHLTGFAMLILMMVLITFKDVRAFF